jgi:hypothetical protein
MYLRYLILNAHDANLQAVGTLARGIKFDRVTWSFDHQPIVMRQAHDGGNVSLQIVQAKNNRLGNSIVATAAI